MVPWHPGRIHLEPVFPRASANSPSSTLATGERSQGPACRVPAPGAVPTKAGGPSQRGRQRDSPPRTARPGRANEAPRLARACSASPRAACVVPATDSRSAHAAQQPGPRVPYAPSPGARVRLPADRGGGSEAEPERPSPARGVPATDSRPRASALTRDRHEQAPCPLPAPCLPLPLTSAPAVHATPAPGAAPGPAGAARPGVPSRESPGPPPPLAALTGRAASRAPRRWRHTTKPPGGRMGEARRSVRLSALPSPPGARKWRRPQLVEADAGGCNARTARTASHNRRWGSSPRRSRSAALGGHLGPEPGPGDRTALSKIPV